MSGGEAQRVKLASELSRKATGRTLVAVDAIGAGVGETVFFVRGKEASFPFYPQDVPTDAGIVGIVDQVSTS